MTINGRIGVTAEAILVEADTDRRRDSARNRPAVAVLDVPLTDVGDVQASPVTAGTRQPLSRHLPFR